MFNYYKKLFLSNLYISLDESETGGTDKKEITDSNKNGTNIDEMLTNILEDKRITEKEYGEYTQIIERYEKEKEQMQEPLKHEIEKLLNDVNQLINAESSLALNNDIKINHKWVKDSIGTGNINIDKPSKNGVIEILNLFKDKTFSKKMNKPSDSALGIYGIQVALSMLLPNNSMGSIDGLYGSNTKKAIIDFQEKWNTENKNDTIKVDGIPGNETITRLIKSLEDKSGPENKPEQQIPEPENKPEQHETKPEPENNPEQQIPEPEQHETKPEQHENNEISENDVSNFIKIKDLKNFDVKNNELKELLKLLSDKGFYLGGSSNRSELFTLNNSQGEVIISIGTFSDEQKIYEKLNLIHENNIESSGDIETALSKLISSVKQFSETSQDIYDMGNKIFELGSFLKNPNISTAYCLKGANYVLWNQVARGQQIGDSDLNAYYLNYIGISGSVGILDTGMRYAELIGSENEKNDFAKRIYEKLKNSDNLSESNQKTFDKAKEILGINNKPSTVPDESNESPVDSGRLNEKIWLTYENGGEISDGDLKSLEKSIDNSDLSIEDRFMYIDTLIRYYNKSGNKDKTKEIAQKYMDFADNNKDKYDIYDYEFAKSRLGVSESEKIVKQNEVSSLFDGDVLKEGLSDEQLLSINEYLVDYGGLKDGSDFLTDHVKEGVLSKNIEGVEYTDSKIIYTKGDGTKWQISEMPWYEDQFKPTDPIKDNERAIVIKELGNSLKQVVVDYSDFMLYGDSHFIDRKIHAADEDYKSELKDDANVKEYELKSPEKLMYVSLSDSSDDVITNGIRRDGELMGKLISNRRGGKETNIHNETISDEKNGEPIDLLRKYFEEAKNTGIHDVVLNVIGHGSEAGIHFGKNKILGIDNFTKLLLEYGDLNVSLNTVACQGGGMEKLSEGLNREGKLYTFLQVQEHVSNQEGRIDGLTNSDGEPKIYSSYYNIYLLHYLNKYPDKTFGEIHLLADKMTKEKMGNNAQIISGSGKTRGITKGLGTSI